MRIRCMDRMNNNSNLVILDFHKKDMINNLFIHLMCCIVRGSIMTWFINYIVFILPLVCHLWQYMLYILIHLIIIYCG